MIFYFCGTGNSDYVARRIAEATNEEYVNIADCEKQSRFRFHLKKKERLGFVIPTYYWRMPALVEDFIKKITHYLQLPQHAKLLDLACGKGRHSITLNKLGFDVLGIDLAEACISFAKQYENEHLKFEVHDMREVYHPNEFDAVFNLFTSFGYFEKYEDNFSVFEAVKQQIKSHGIFVLDYLNAEKVVSHMIPYEEKVIDGILFKITKSIENGFIKNNTQLYDNWSL